MLLVVVIGDDMISSSLFVGLKKSGEVRLAEGRLTTPHVASSLAVEQTE